MPFRRSGRAALLLAALLVPTAACTATSAPAPTSLTPVSSPTSSTPVSSASAPASTAVVTTVPGSTAPPTSAPVASSAPGSTTVSSPVASPTPIPKLDRTSAAWYGAICQAQQALKASASGVQGADLAAEQASAQAAYNDLANTAKATVGTLTGLAAPLLPDAAAGRSIKTHRLAEFQAFASGYRAGAVTIGAAKVTTQAQLSDVVNKIETDVTAAVGKAGAGAPVVPDTLQAAINLLPDCGGT